MSKEAYPATQNIKNYLSTKGYRGTKHRFVKVAREAALHAGVYAYRGRKNLKRDMRRLWIVRISEAVKKEGMSYGLFINRLKATNIHLNRKVLADLVLNDPTAFKNIVNKVKTK